MLQNIKKKKKFKLGDAEVSVLSRILENHSSYIYIEYMAHGGEWTINCSTPVNIYIYLIQVVDDGDDVKQPYQTCKRCKN